MKERLDAALGAVGLKHDESSADAVEIFGATDMPSAPADLRVADPQEQAQAEQAQAEQAQAPEQKEKDGRFDPVDNPAHYCEGRTYMPIDVIEDWELGFNLGSCLKYIARAGRKGDALEDLKKARFYLDREIGTMERRFKEE
nr:MAG TPA: nucelotide kinase [Caudoviricetes sp.]